MADAYADAAVRHGSDAELLNEEHRLPDADQLYGFAAECALKAALLKIPGCVSSGVLQRRYKEHVGELWELIPVQSIEKIAPGLVSLLRMGTKPFADWSIDQRYESGEATEVRIRRSDLERYAEEAPRRRAPGPRGGQLAWRAKGPVTMRFDDALDAMVARLVEQFPEKAPEGTTIVRDAMGMLTLVLPDASLPPEAWARLAAEIDASLGRFSPGHRRVLLRTSDLIDAGDVLDSRDRVLLPDHPGIALVDRLLTNQDWLREPRTIRPPLPKATFFSIEGGVGRSTAAAVLAWHLARAGQRVLVVDLDLEAPGIGGMLLSELPDYGVVDWCVESLAGAADAELFEKMLAPSPLAEDTSGDIRVIPAYGRRTRDYVAKVGRAYMPSFGADGTQLGLADRLVALLQTAAARIEPPDVVLLDARAGLHDIGSAAVTQLGAEVFLFARPDEQGLDGYSRLFEHLRRARSVRFGMPEGDLRWQLKMVAAQIEPTVGAFEAAVEDMYEIWTAFYDDGELRGAQEFSRGDESAPHYPIPVMFDPRVRAFELLASDRRPPLDLVDSVFGQFVAIAAERLQPEPGGGSAQEEAP